MACVDKILDKLERCRRRLDQIEPGCADLKRKRQTPEQVDSYIWGITLGKQALMELGEEK
jgi:hypothetical protein